MGIRKSSYACWANFRTRSTSPFAFVTPGAWTSLLAANLLLIGKQEAPSRSSEGPNAGWMTVVGRDPVVHADPGSQPFCPACVALQAEINTIRDAITVSGFS